MLAVGVSAETVAPYLETEPAVQIACFDSSTSLILSGQQPDLVRVCDRLKADGHFARMLQVNLAYHSEHHKRSRPPDSVESKTCLPLSVHLPSSQQLATEAHRLMLRLEAIVPASGSQTVTGHPMSWQVSKTQAGLSILAVTPMPLRPAATL